ncbi:hypothetical protein [Agrococcus beijingensis]|uniref:hypothetical protein n=1 Tax=Agrococcus beijingensis TaxID=3068634 RepID=UPI002741D79D|nr:hypothetical protein [Agrococcus sp. REN33]
MDAIFGLGQGLSIVVLALGLGALVLGLGLLRAAARRRGKLEAGQQRRVLAIVLVVAGALLAVFAAISWIVALTAGG